ncbi:MAG: glycosyl hydrolase [Armatimonadetes bacterium]|nr:glycosyl hydrolase [Armatimonadota bacterium]
MWFWNGKLDADKTRTMVAACKAAGYYGMGILPCNGMGVDFMSPAFLRQYRVAVDEAARLGMRMCLYDEFWFPSGSAGGLLAKRRPEALSKRLDMLATDVTGPREFTQVVPEGTLMGAVAMEAATKRRLDITAAVSGGRLRWNVPGGDWKVMVFTCVRDGRDGLVDYLEPKAVDAFIKLTHQAYHDAMPERFGSTIDGAFYDEPAFYHVAGGRAWTDRFNDAFRARHGTHPITLYPALWFDIGPDTSAARNALFGMRAELYANGFVKTLNDWCAAHRMGLTGHADQEELVNPVIGSVGDLMKSFKHQSMPGIDQVFAYGRASRAYKVVSSAASNYDRPQVMTECYGAMDLPLPNLYKEAMDQFAKGINTMVPHAVWYDPDAIVFKPDLSPGAPKYGPELPAYNHYIGRLQRMLQGGRHVADIGVLYPIATLQAGSWFGPGNPYEGCVDIPEADYMEVGEALSLGVRRDFTFVHPEVLQDRCAVEGATIIMNNKVNHERWRAFIIPGSRCISVAALRRIKRFYDQGGAVIATTRLPDHASESGGDAEVRRLVRSIFGADAALRPDAPRVTASSSWAGGGYDPPGAMDGSPLTRWNAADGSKAAQWIEADLGRERIVGGVVVREAFGRVRGYRVQAWNGKEWVDQAKGERLGERAEVTFTPVSTNRVRLLMEAVESDSASIAEWTILGADGRDLFEREASACHRNARGGRAWFLPAPSVAALKAVLAEALPDGDVEINHDQPTRNGNLSYIHEWKDDRSLYFLANSSDDPVDTWVTLRGKVEPEVWDPHTGKASAAEVRHATGKQGPVTRVHVNLQPVRSLFLVAPDAPNPH